MNAPFTAEDRQRGFQTMTAQLSPAARVRRRFLQGRRKKVSIRHTPLSAVNAAADAILEVLEYIHENEPALPPDSARCAVAYRFGQEETGLREITPETALAALQELNGIPEFIALGLVLVVQEQLPGEPAKPYGWTKPFIWSEENRLLLNGALNRQLKHWGQK
jgi:hypothetical protein